jgi:hypothetical protein
VPTLERMQPCERAERVRTEGCRVERRVNRSINRLCQLVRGVWAMIVLVCMPTLAPHTRTCTSRRLKEYSELIEVLLRTHYVYATARERQ